MVTDALGTSTVTDRFKLPGMHLTGHKFSVPINYEDPGKGSIDVYAREVVSLENAERECPWLIFFQGGPGFPSPRPSSKSGWLKRALKEYRVLLLDQRGTGLSSPLTYQTLSDYESPQKLANFLRHFRADSIIKDAELIRTRLLKPGQRWTALGQSYGGFCTTNYLSSAPNGLDAAIITGGLPPLTAHIDDIYRATYKRVLGKNHLYYNRYPMDVERVREIVEILNTTPAQLPDGGTLTAERFQQLGIAFGMSEGFEQIHYLLEEGIVNKGKAKELSYTFLRNLAASQMYETNPIYAFLHEAIYCQHFASNWSAHRVRAEFPEFSNKRPDGPILFTGEMIYPSMFDDYKNLRPLKEAAQILAEFDDWTALYNVDVLKNNTVPTVAAVYYDDMYVETAYSEDAAKQISNVRTWVTSEYEHNGIRADGERVLDRLLQMLNGEIM